MTEYGWISVSPREEIVVGSRVTLTFTYRVGAAGVKHGGSLRIATPNDAWEWPEVPMHRYFQKGRERGGYDDGYCSYARRNVSAAVETSGPAWIDLSAEERSCVGNLTGPWARHIVAIVRDGDLVEGDVITVVYGDRTWGEDGVRAQEVAPTDKDSFRAYLDITGDREFVELPADDLRFRVRPGPPARFNVVAPAVVRPGEPFEVRLAATDEFRNRPSEAFVGELRVGCSKPSVRLRGAAALSEGDGNVARLEGVAALEEGIYRLQVEPAEGGRRDLSNPIWCTRRELNVYFGDLHCQSQWHSDSIGTPAEGYGYGRDVAGLDFMGITDASGCFKEEGWQETQEAAARFYEPGRFVTLKGFEYGASRGHRNVIYRDCEIEPVLDDLPRNDLPAFFRYFRGRDVVIIPHHTKVWTEWDFHDPELEPLVEAYSCWGSGVEHADPLWHKSEKPGSGVFNALRRGYRLGFIGSGDSHAGMPGRSHPQDRQWCVHQKSGFACVYAPELTREAIFDALKQRRCYATTGARILLEFSVNAAPMGQSVPLARPEEPRVIRVHAIGTDRFRLLRIVKNNEELTRRELHDDEVFFEYQDVSLAAEGDFYFVRLVQEDENTAWSSSVWVALPQGW